MRDGGGIVHRYNTDTSDKANTKLASRIGPHSARTRTSNSRAPTTLPESFLFALSSSDEEEADEGRKATEDRSLEVEQLGGFLSALRAQGDGVTASSKGKRC